MTKNELEKKAIEYAENHRPYAEGYEYDTPIKQSYIAGYQQATKELQKEKKRLMKKFFHELRIL